MDLTCYQLGLKITSILSRIHPAFGVCVVGKTSLAGKTIYKSDTGGNWPVKLSVYPFRMLDKHFKGMYEIPIYIHPCGDYAFTIEKYNPKYHIFGYDQLHDEIFYTFDGFHELYLSDQRLHDILEAI